MCISNIDNRTLTSIDTVNNFNFRALGEVFMIRDPASIDQFWERDLSMIMCQILEPIIAPLKVSNLVL